MSVKGIPEAVLMAPDSFKGTFSALAVAEALGRGVAETGRPVDLCPVSDGGEGLVSVLADALGLSACTVEVSDPLGRPISAVFGLGPDGVAVLETAAASGLGLVAADERDAIAATTRGTGELIIAARDAGARRIVIGAGGSATTDGGTGAVDAILAAGGLDGVRLVVLSDVRTRFEDAARVFGPQKGASVADVAALSQRLGAQAARYVERFGRDPRGVPATGAAGGLSGGLWAAFGAELAAGAPYVLEALDFDRRMRAARAVITGEGRLDLQSLAGKVVSEVATRARQAGVPCYAVVGCDAMDPFGKRILDFQQVLTAADTLEAVHAAARAIAERL